MKRTGIGLLALCVLTSSGCADEDDDAPTCTDWNVPRSARPDIPLRRQTEHLDIHSEGFVCGGTALEFERHVGFVAEQFGLDLRTNIPVYMVQSRPKQWCRDHVLGCVHTDGSVFTLPSALEHELGHSAACELRRNVQPAIAEGLAVMFQSSWSTWSPSADDDLRELLEADNDHLSYGNVGHFARWLFERDGAETFAALYRRAHGRKHTIAAIEDLYGASLEQLEAEYLADAPYAWVPFRQCADLPHVEPDDDGVWRYSAMMDCENESTLGPYLREVPRGDRSQMMAQSFTFTLDEYASLDHDLQGDIDQVTFERCYDEHPGSWDDVQWDVLTISTDPKTGFVYFPGLDAGTWRVNVLMVHGPPQPIGVALWDD